MSRPMMWRQLLRRAVLEGYLLGKREPFLHTLVPAVATAMRGGYPEILETNERVALVIHDCRDFDDRDEIYMNRPRSAATGHRPGSQP